MRSEGCVIWVLGVRGSRSRSSTYVDAPEFLDGVECDDLLQQIIPIVALGRI